MAVLDDHDPVMMVTMPALIAMHFGTCVETVMIMPDHDFFRTCYRWRCDGNRAKRGNNVSKLLHVILLI
jgi:hypothetical protein